ncbi:acid protease [Lichtheimia hyalospora FSU 10163]|nr:acid protease [Lichtheimia hyalospora FSU 10163]
MKPVTILLSLALLLLVVAINTLPASSDRLSSRQQQERTKESHPLSLPLRRYKGRKNHHIQRRQQSNTSTLDGGNDTVRVTPGLYDMAMTEFAIPISIGTPAREFLLLFDTGSADTWVIGPSCTNTTTCAADNVYDPKASTTYASTPYDFIINYAIGSSNGTYAVDQVAVDDAVLSQQMFAVVNDTEHFFTAQDPNSQYTIDGILGASYPWSTSLQAYYNVSYLPIPFALYAAHLIPDPVFSVHMGDAFQQHNSADTSTANEIDMWTGSITFGAVNTSIIDPQTIHYTNISVWRQYATNDTGYMFWDGRANQITMESINNTVTPILSWNMTHAPSFIIDTGSNYFSMPEQDAQELIINHLAPEARIRQGQGGYYVDCNNTRLSDNTTISIHFYDSEDHTGATFPLTFPISDLVFQVDEEQCILAISPGNQYVVGNFILYRFLSIFDFGSHRVGFAPLQGSL